MCPQTKTDLFLLVWVMAAIVWDVVAIIFWGIDATISRRVWFWAATSEIIRILLAVLFGMLVGHWLLPQRLYQG
jgi:hypothetical protein